MSSTGAQDERRKAHNEDNEGRKEKHRKETGDSNTASGAPLIKDEISLLGLLVLYVGIITTDAYYGQFGLRYQLLGLDSLHIMYRGLTGLIYAPYLIAPFFLAALWLRLDFILAREKHPRLYGFRRLISYFFLFFILASSYVLAVMAGNSLARLDSHEETCLLPKVVYMRTVDGELPKPETSEYYRLLTADASYVTFFSPLQRGQTGATPNIKRYRREDVHVLETTR